MAHDWFALTDPDWLFFLFNMPLRNSHWTQRSRFFIDEDFTILVMRNVKRRDTLAILSNLLENMKEPRRLTHLLYASNLSYSQLSKYLKMVTEMGLAQEQKKPFHSYFITNEGKFFVEMVNKRQEKIQIIPPLNHSE